MRATDELFDCWEAHPEPRVHNPAPSRMGAMLLIKIRVTNLIIRSSFLGVRTQSHLGVATKWIQAISCWPSLPTGSLHGDTTLKPVQSKYEPYRWMGRKNALPRDAPRSQNRNQDSDLIRSIRALDPNPGLKANTRTSMPSSLSSSNSAISAGA